jgi:hypothetical protein
MKLSTSLWFWPCPWSLHPAHHFGFAIVFFSVLNGFGRKANNGWKARSETVLQEIWPPLFTMSCAVQRRCVSHSLLEWCLLSGKVHLLCASRLFGCTWKRRYWRVESTRQQLQRTALSRLVFPDTPTYMVQWFGRIQRKHMLDPRRPAACNYGMHSDARQLNLAIKPPSLLTIVSLFDLSSI